MEKNSQLKALLALGQSVWYDNLSRDLLNSGDLATLIQQGVTGLTSNPAIFKKSIADSNTYDLAMKLPASMSDEAVCEKLMIEDVARASDLLRPIYDASNGYDGHASIEVSPFLAADEKGTTAAALRTWKELNRPNGMIKIPATKPCIASIRDVLAQGINVNVTLIFSSDVYKDVANAYIDALKERKKKGLSNAKIASVASFFVSRVDAICEKSFDALVKSGAQKEENRAQFFGKIGIANSKLAYKAFEEIFGDPAAFEANYGTKVQRPLWASTGTKNPTLSPVLYVEELAGRHTVNTMPPATLTAVMKGATIEPRLHSKIAEAAQCVAAVEKLGIPFSSLLVTLQEEGVKLFADAYRELLASIQKKRAAL